MRIAFFLTFALNCRLQEFLFKIQELVSVKKKFIALNCCVIIPTYNNAKTLESVIREINLYTDDIIVVNDGSTDATGEIIRQFPQIQTVTLSKNTGKGFALRKGFAHAMFMGYRYAITIDSDGQHFPHDLEKFLDKVSEVPGSMIVGSRNMQQASVPGTSSFGHKFSLFWYSVETGNKIADVQTGYRLYPLEELKKMRFYSRKYEFEVEALVRLAWNSVPVESVPVDVWYAPKSERVTHFRKFRDFTRVSIMNTILVFLAILWYRPVLFIKNIRKQSLRKLLNEYVFNSQDSNSKLSWSAATGVFFGIAPFWGWQMLMAYTAARALKLNKFIAVGASNISFPPFLPFIIFLSYEVGGLFMGIESNGHYTAGINFHWIKDNIFQYVVGSFIFASLLSILLGSSMYFILKIFRKPKTTS